MKYENHDLADLFFLAKQGDATAFEQIVLQTEKQVYSLALSVTKSREDAEDAAQETYLRLWRSLPENKSIQSAKYYIMKTAYNASVDLLRSRRRMNEAETVIFTDEGEFDRDIADTDPSSRPDLCYFEKVKAQTVRECIDELPEGQRRLIVMRDINELSYSEIAHILGIPEGTVKSGIFRARERLRVLILRKNIL